MVVFLVQMRPWRLEDDLWKSFVGLRLEEVEGLDGEWVD